MTDFNAIANKYILDLYPYQAGKPIEELVRERGIALEDIIKLASNENPLGMSPKARAAIETALAGGHYYPEQYALVRAIAKRRGVSEDMVVLGNGSNDVLDFVARVFLNEGDESVMSQYAFVVYELATRSVGANPVIVPAKAYGHDLDAMLAAITSKTKVLWVANANNPTGTFIPYAEIKTFLGKVPAHVIVVLDEAYYEYLAPEQREDTTLWLAEYPNLILVRTFSKMYGLAGLRVGYGLMHAQVAGLLNRVRPPFNVNRLSAAAAVAALEDEDFVRKSYNVNAAGRKQLLAGLRKQGIATIGEEGNFITFEIENAAATIEYLLTQGIIIRPLANYSLPNHLRVTIGTEMQNQRFLKALAAPTSTGRQQ